MTTKKRIIQYLEYKKITKKDFFIKTGIKRGFLDTDKLNKPVTDENIIKISKTFQDLNPIWLLFNEGQMLLSNTQEELDTFNNLKENQSKTPLIQGAIQTNNFQNIGIPFRINREATITRNYDKLKQNDEFINCIYSLMAERANLVHEQNLDYKIFEEALILTIDMLAREEAQTYYPILLYNKEYRVNACNLNDFYTQEFDGYLNNLIRKQR